MASQITETIGLRSFELVRDQIGAILYDELPNQATLNGDTRLNSEVFVERFRPVADEEVKKKSIIVVELSQGDYNMKTITSQDGMYIFNIDCYEFGFSTSTTRGDKTASVKLQRLLGVVQGILSHPKYSTLGFQSPFIEHTEVSGFKIGDPTGKKDAASMVLGRIEFKVRVPDKLNGSAPVPIDGYTTQALLGETALGYTYGTQTLPPVEPVCQGVEIKLNGILIVNAESGADIDIPIKDTAGDVVGSWNGSEFIVPENAIDNYDITINGSAFETINSNTDIPVKDTTGASVGSKVGSEYIVPAGSTTKIYIRPMPTGASTIYATHDDAWKVQNNVDTYVAPSSGIPMLLNNSDYRMLINDHSFGHKFRRTGKTGGYYDHLTDDFRDINGTITTEILSYPDMYIIDNHTGLAVLNKDLGLQTFANGFAVVNALVEAGFSDYFTLNANEGKSITSVGGDSIVQDPYGNWGNNRKFLSTTSSNALIHWSLSGNGTLSTRVKSSQTSSVIAMRYHFT